MRGLLLPLSLLATWLALWGEITLINVASGITVVAIVSLVLRHLPRSGHRLHPVGLIRLLVIFMWRLISSSASVVMAVMAPSPARLRSGVVGVGLTNPSPLVAAIVADAISLTPGTLTLDVRYPGRRDGVMTPVIYVHVLGLPNPDAIRDDVRRLERLVLSAMTPATSNDGEIHTTLDKGTPP